MGKVAAFGSNVKGLEVGDCVGVGWWKESCGTPSQPLLTPIRCQPSCPLGSCICCLNGDEQICRSGVATCAGTSRGGFANRFRGHQSGVFKIPATLDPATAAPLVGFQPVVVVVCLEHQYLLVPVVEWTITVA